jgi:hypothetical protein
MRGLDPRIHFSRRWIAGSSASEATPFFERLCPAMTFPSKHEMLQPICFAAITAR